MDDKDTKSSSWTGSWIFLVFIAVLAFHVLAILGIAIFNGWKFPGTETAKTQNPTPVQLQAPELEKNKLPETAEMPVPKAEPVKRIEKVASPELDALAKELLANTDNEDVVVPIPKSQEPVPTAAKKDDVDRIIDAVADGVDHEKNFPKTSSVETVKKAAPADLDIAEPVRNPASAAAPKVKTASPVKTTAVPPLVVSNPTKKTLTSGDAYGTYNVQKGDTLNKIARQFNTTTDILSKINLIKDPHSLKVGMTLKVPKK
ncbi:MAG TPA: hypothetical protein DCZ94_11350 [Lentisphaeria bacterium]|nr:MAG: hypothetical protein A2X48_17450 [Lentisphaerae bacterium GWF2_49_21]HBC87542.1 hypothetical protein [Lentisphaeria bacterium]